MSNVKQDSAAFGQALPQIGLPSQLIGCIPDGLPVPDASAVGELDTVLTRYYVLNDIVDDEVVGIEQAAVDRTQFAHLRTPGEVEFGAMVEFMHLASGLIYDTETGDIKAALPRAWCATWAYLEEFAQVQAGLLTEFSDLRSREDYIETLRLIAVDAGGKQS
ncbi:MAG TPA: hypothetical protein VGI93_01550 [Steroidobacteraceae bacterium]|jgi:hypothetical protein